MQHNLSAETPKSNSLTAKSRALQLIDSILLSSLKSSMMEAAKSSGVGDAISPAPSLIISDSTPLPNEDNIGMPQDIDSIAVNGNRSFLLLNA